MKFVESFYNVVPLSGCTIFRIDVALNKEAYITPALLKIIEDALKTSTEISEVFVKNSSIKALTDSLFLMFNYGVFVDFENEKIITENRDSKEFWVLILNTKDLSLHLKNLINNTPDAPNWKHDSKSELFTKTMKHKLEQVKTETNYTKVWKDLVSFSKSYFDNI